MLKNHALIPDLKFNEILYELRPVLDPSGATVIAAVGVSGPVERLTRDPGARHGRRVADAAREIEVAAR